MSTRVMTARIVEWSRHPRARVTGVVYLLYFLTAVLGQSITGRGLVTIGSSISLVGTLLYLALTLLFYFLLRPVNRNVAWLAALCGLLGCANDILSQLHLAPFRINSLLFFGPFDSLIGYLIIRSTFMPKLLGWLMALAGPGWLIALTLPPAHPVVIYLVIFGGIAEILLMLWLLVKGVNVQRWQEQASTAGLSYRRAQEGIRP